MHLCSFHVHIFYFGDHRDLNLSSSCTVMSSSAYLPGRQWISDFLVYLNIGVQYKLLLIHCLPAHVNISESAQKVVGMLCVKFDMGWIMLHSKEHLLLLQVLDSWSQLHFPESKRFYLYFLLFISYCIIG